MQLKYGPYSPSRLETATCGYSFYRQYVDPNRVRPPEQVPQARGGAVHEVFEQITKRLCQKDSPLCSPDEVRKWVVDAVSRHPAAYEETGEIIEMARLYLERPPAILTEDAGIELRLAVKIVDGQFVECDYEDPQAIGRGRADIMLISDDTTTALVYDHKTQPNTEEADTFQMGFYAWVISKSYPFLDRIETVLHFARYGKYSQPFVWTKEDLAKIEDEILTRIEIIESRTSWEATPNKMCQYCPYMSECPALKELIEVDECGNTQVKMDNLQILGSAAKAAKFAGYYNVLSEIRAKVNDELKEHVKKYGAIAIPGKIYEFRPSDEIHWDAVNKKLRKETYEIFEKYGIDPRAFMSFNQTASKSIWMAENEQLVRELAALFPRKTTTTFKGYKL